MPTQKTFRGVEGQVELIFLLMSSDAMPSITLRSYAQHQVGSCMLIDA
jgi:hypothetical protein